MLLNLDNPFELTVRENGNETIYKGLFRSLTKTELKEFENKNKSLQDKLKQGQELVKKVERKLKEISLKEKQEDWAAVEELTKEADKLEDELNKFQDGLNSETEMLDIWRYRFNTCLVSDNKDEIIALCERVGYEPVYSKIQEAIAEEKEKK